MNAAQHFAITRSIANHNSFPIGLGAMPLSLTGKPSEQDAIKVMLRFFERGGNFIDTADVYGLDDQDRGHNEKLVAKAIKQYGNKHPLLIATKGGASRPEGGWALGNGHPKQLRKACEQSLKNLGMDAHELYYLHGPDRKIPLTDSLGELVTLKNEGKIKHIGIANVDMADLYIALQLTPVAAVQNRCNPFCKEDFTNGLIDFCRSHNIAYVPYCPLGGWGKHDKLALQADFQTMAARYQTSTYVLSLAWLLQKADHIIPIPGMDRCEHVDINTGAVNVQLAIEDVQRIDAFANLYASKHVDPA